MKTNTKKISILVIILVVIGIIVFFNLNKRSRDTLSVEVGKVEKEKIVQSISASGTLQPSKQVSLSARVSAKILSINANEGHKVQKGDTLVELRNKRYKAAYNRATASLSASRAEYRRLKNELERQKKLYKNNHISKSELQKIRAQTKRAKSNVESAKSSLEEAEEQIDNTIITAPISGSITSLIKEEGEMATGSRLRSNSILTVSDMSTMEVVVDVDETEIIEVEKGDTAEVEIDALPDTTYKGVVSQISHSANLENQQTQQQVTNFEVKINLLQLDKRFKPGMSAMVDIITEVRKDAPGVPIKAVTIRDVSDSLEESKEKEVVFKVKSEKDGYSAIRQPVNLGISSDTRFEVKQGVEPGDSIVTGPYDAISKNLDDGKPIEF